MKPMDAVYLLSAFLLTFLVGRLDPTPTANGSKSQDEIAVPHDAIAVGVPVPSWTTKAKVIHVVDGDTVDVEIRRVVRIRLLDCWAPETHHDGRLVKSEQEAEFQRGLASRENLKALCDGKAVVVQVPTAEEVAQAITMGRWLGELWLLDDPESLNQKQVRGGFADKSKPEKFR